ncbi:MAG: hypothetical protein ACTHMC_09815 [Pseudobacter sp.]|uniref:hypothetical protein n=1 Tax=Pseudobacter sp. TaxID=2045420 RepID=UPI003F7D59AF
MSTEKKVIMYDSEEAAKQVTVTGWVSSDGRFFGKDEHAARYAGCTHGTCECGNPTEKGWLKCESCRHKASAERYQKLEFQEWDGITPLCIYGDDQYFFNEDELEDFLYEREMNGTDICLVLCVPVRYGEVRYECFADDTHEDWEPTPELTQKLNEFNQYLRSLPCHSWTAGKIRTSYEYTYVPE